MNGKDIHHDVWIEQWTEDYLRFFEQEKQCITAAVTLSGLQAEIFHVGSTSVRDLPGKEIIDIQAKKQGQVFVGLEISVAGVHLMSTASQTPVFLLLVEDIGIHFLRPGRCLAPLEVRRRILEHREGEWSVPAMRHLSFEHIHIRPIRKMSLGMRIERHQIVYKAILAPRHSEGPYHTEPLPEVGENLLPPGLGR